MVAFGPALRRRFLLEPGIAFLNHGSFGAAPRAVLAAQARWRRRIEANPDRFMREVLPRALRKAAGKLAGFLNADEKDLVFVENATAGANAVLRSLRLRPGDEILSTNHGYNAVRQAIRFVCERTGARSAEMRIGLPLHSFDSFLAGLEKRIHGKTRLLVIDHISSPTGLVFPVKRIAALAHARGVPVLVDGAHAPGQVALDVPALGADWYAGNCHKWLFAPKGCGFLWARPRARRELHPLAISHGYGKGFAAEFDWTGTRDFSGWLAVPEALAFFRELGPSRLRSHNHRLVTSAAGSISAAWGTPLDAPPGLHGSMIAIRLPAALQRRDPAALMRELFARHRTVAVVNAL
ncbi:MAG: aminotransferase class V-fold PLP-dependent enzyme, partial [Pseudomonadota bacterium]